MPYIPCVSSGLDCVACGIVSLQGNREAQSKFVPSRRSAFHTDDFGYTRMVIPNATHLYLEEMSVNKVNCGPCFSIIISSDIKSNLLS